MRQSGEWISFGSFFSESLLGARNELIAANAVTIFIVESLLKAVHDCIERAQIARPIIFRTPESA